MPKISISHPSKTESHQAMTVIQKFFETDTDLKSLDSAVKCQFEPGSLKGKITGSKFKADLEIEPQGSGSLIKLVVDLPLLLSPFKGKIEHILLKKLNQNLA